MPRQQLIVVRRGSTVPAASDFQVGELAWDATGKEFYVKASDGSMVPLREPPDGSITDAKIQAAGLAASSISWVEIAPWQANTSYTKGQLVEQGGIAYRRLAAGISGATFNTANWQRITPNTPPSHTHSVVTTTTAGFVAAKDFGSITYAATINLDLSAFDGQTKTINLTGNIAFTVSNMAAGREFNLRIICDSTQRTLTFPTGWVFVCTKPSSIAASKTAKLSVECYGSNETDCIVGYAVQP